MWVKLKDLQVGTPFYLTSNPVLSDHYNVVEIKQDGMVMRSAKCRDSSLDFWDWKEVESTNLVWIESQVEGNQ